MQYALKKVKADRIMSGKCIFIFVILSIATNRGIIFNYRLFVKLTVDEAQWMPDSRGPIKVFILIEIYKYI